MANCRVTLQTIETKSRCCGVGVKLIASQMKTASNVGFIRFVGKSFSAFVYNISAVCLLAQNVSLADLQTLMNGREFISPDLHCFIEVSPLNVDEQT
jgi:hypothetical protein